MRRRQTLERFVRRLKPSAGSYAAAGALYGPNLLLASARMISARMPPTLRALADGDLDSLFAWESDPLAVQLAAFTRADTADRGAFDAHYERIRNDPACTLRAIDLDGELVGTIGSFTREGEREVTYWIAPARWGQGLASRALRAFLEIERVRPLYGRVAQHNVGSAKVLERAGFVEVGAETSFAPGVGAEIVERIYRLDR